MPVLTRLYSEEDFAAYTTFFSVATIFSVAAAGRYQYGIAIPRSEKKARALYRISGFLTSWYAVALILVSIFAVGYFGSYFIFIPLYVFGFGFWSANVNWSIREKTFKRNAVSKVVQSVVYIFAAIMAGLISPGSTGLILGKTLGLFSSAAYIHHKGWRSFAFPKWQGLSEIATEFSSYPKFNLFPSLLNTFTLQSLVLVLTFFYSKEELGNYGLTFMVLSVPLSLVGMSYRDVFLQRLTEHINTGRVKETLRLFMRSAVFLLASGLVISLVLLAFGPELFGFVFGDNWTLAGAYASVLTFGVMFRLAASPLSAVFNVTDQLRQASYWQYAFFISTVIQFLITVVFLQLDVFRVLMVYVCHEVIFYSLYLWLEHRVLKQFAVAFDK